MSISLSAQKGAAKPMLWISMASMVMIFAGLTSGYVVRRAEGDWTAFNLPDAFTTSTILIAISSLVLILAGRFIKKGDAKLAAALMSLTLILGIAFTWMQYNAWTGLVDMGISLLGPGSNPSGSFLFVLTFAHLLHLGAGLIAMLVTLINCFKGKYTAESKLGFELASIFWHFLGILWLYLYLFLLFIR